MADEEKQGTPPADGAEPAAQPPATEPEPEKTQEQLDAEKKAADEAKEAERKDAEETEKKPWYRKRFDELTRKNTAAEERAIKAEKRAERLEETVQQILARLPGGQTPGATPDAPPAPAPPFQPTRPAPTLEQFEFDQDKYMDAVVDWKLEQREAKTQHERMVAEQQTMQQSVMRELEKSRVMAIEEGRTKYPDFDQVVFSLPPDVMDLKMLAAVLQTDNPADICYHLGKHPEEAKKLAQLPALKLAKTLGNIEASMAARAARTSQAPPPPNPVGGGRVPATPKEDNLPYDEWLRRRQAGQIDGRA